MYLGMRHVARISPFDACADPCQILHIITRSATGRQPLTTSSLAGWTSWGRTLSCSSGFRTHGPGDAALCQNGTLGHCRRRPGQNWGQILQRNVKLIEIMSMQHAVVETGAHRIAELGTRESTPWPSGKLHSWAATFLCWRLAVLHRVLCQQPTIPHPTKRFMHACRKDTRIRGATASRN